ncbi:MAG: DoxX family protein [Calditrichaeota bacterium]|nr:MAG: DoxX family protein [Calditrichota bacterium]RPH99053.1 MAG: DoxX family protein [Calditrichota bacterium]
MDDKYTNVQKTALVILRVLIGWHFLYEGVAKLLKGTWSAAGYLSQARGILAPFFTWIANTDSVLTVVNLMNIWGLIAIGLGLIMGCFTRAASYAGMLLILLYYLANPPFVGFFYSIPMEGNYLIVNKNLVEMAALFLIAVTHSGYYAGLDRLIQKMFCKQK